MLNEEICKVRDKLNKSIEKNVDYAIIYNKDYKILNCQMPDLPYSDHLPVILELTK